MGSFPTDKSITYLKFLEDYCKKNKILILYDEIITGLDLRMDLCRKI